MRHLLSLGVGLTLCLFASALTDTILILHTNDIHDHIRTSLDGSCGLPLVAGYLKEARASRPDTLLLDAGDITEKGDMVAFKTRGAMLFEAMNRIGYDAAAPGNHDVKPGLDRLAECAGLAPDIQFLCANLDAPGGGALFPASHVFDVDGVRVGVIGLTRPGDAPCRTMEDTVEGLKAESARLSKEVDLLVVLAHMSSRYCREMSQSVPEVDVFVGGHSHEAIESPIQVPETGALIVQAGMYGRYVGRLDLEIDLETGKVVKSSGCLVPMRRGETPEDLELARWVAQKEQEICPEARRVVAQCPTPLGALEVAHLAADALRESAGADIGFCHPGAIIRDGIAAGDVDVNALFLTGGQRGHVVVRAQMTGQEINDYLARLLDLGNGRAVWAGFKAQTRHGKDAGWAAESDLDPTRTYTVAMCELEWESRLASILEKRTGAPTDLEAAYGVEQCPFTFIDALENYAEKLRNEDVTLDARAKDLSASAGMKLATATP